MKELTCLLSINLAFVMLMVWLGNPISVINAFASGVLAIRILDRLREEKE